MSAKLKAIDEQIAEKRGLIRNLQRDPASNPPLIVQLGTLPSTEQFLHSDV